MKCEPNNIVQYHNFASICIYISTIIKHNRLIK